MPDKITPSTNTIIEDTAPEMLAEDNIHVQRTVPPPLDYIIADAKQRSSVVTCSAAGGPGVQYRELTH